MLPRACCLLPRACCLLHRACCLLHRAYCLLHVVCCVLHVVSRTSRRIEIFTRTSPKRVPHSFELLVQTLGGKIVWQVKCFRCSRCILRARQCADRIRCVRQKYIAQLDESSRSTELGALSAYLSVCRV